MHPIEVLLTPLGRAFRNRRADERASVSHASGLAAERRIAVTSPAFADGQEIPAKYCGRLIGDNVSPALVWGPLPPATSELLLVLEDLDSPGKTPRPHTIAVFAPVGNGLPEGALAADAEGVRFLPVRNPLAYSGPRPLPGHGPHRYRFHLYALDLSIADMATLTDLERVLAAVAGHVLASGALTGVRES